jgi:hypothetical protein
MFPGMTQTKGKKNNMSFHENFSMPLKVVKQNCQDK